MIFQLGSGVNSNYSGFGGYVELDIIGIAMEMETMMREDVTKGVHEENEQERPKH